MQYSHFMPVPQNKVINLISSWTKFQWNVPHIMVFLSANELSNIFLNENIRIMTVTGHPWQGCTIFQMHFHEWKILYFD